LKDKSEYPLGIFPEGTTTNGTVLLAFKPGVFYTKTPVKPFVYKTNGKYLNPNYDCVGFIELTVLLLS